MTLAELVLTGLLVAGSHSGGHIQKANEFGIPAHLDGLAEVLESDVVIEKSMLAAIDGAGFKTQDKLSLHFQKTQLQDSYNLANAVYKIGYLAGSPKFFGLTVPDDLDSLDSTARIAVILSAANDIYRLNHPESSININFWCSSRGVPGLIVTMSSK